MLAKILARTKTVTHEPTGVQITVRKYAEGVMAYLQLKAMEGQVISSPKDDKDPEKVTFKIEHVRELKESQGLIAEKIFHGTTEWPAEIGPHDMATAQAIVREADPEFTRWLVGEIDSWNSGVDEKNGNG